MQEKSNSQQIKNLTYYLNQQRNSNSIKSTNKSDVNDSFDFEKMSFWCLRSLQYVDLQGVDKISTSNLTHF